jgi:two-component system, OmpR family, alkaline phosphatase synthesis response regulator PhoP
MNLYPITSKTMPHPLRVLIAEDNEFLRMAVAGALEDEGMTVVRVSDGSKVLGTLSKDSFDLLLLDLILPVKNGFEILQEIKKRKIRVPVLVFTNLSQKKDREEALRLGAKAFYVKSSLSIDEVVRVVKKYAPKKN